MSKFYSSIGRRDLLKWGGISLAAAGSLTWQVQPARAEHTPATSSVTPDEALQALLEGNQRFIQQKMEDPARSPDRVREVAQGQHPFVTILGCADSRVPAEIIFDRGIGEVFDIRLAGNIVTPEALASIEYAAFLLGTPLILVLGHERCGAVTAAVKGEVLPGEIGAFVRPIKPAIARIKNLEGDPVENAVVANVRYQVEKLQKVSSLLPKLVRDGKLKIVGGRYDLDTGEVTIL